MTKPSIASIALALLAAAPAAALAAPYGTTTPRGTTAPIYNAPNGVYRLDCKLTTDAARRFLPSASIRNTSGYNFRPGTRIDVEYSRHVGGKRFQSVRTPTQVGNQPLLVGGTLSVPGVSPSWALACTATVTIPNTGKAPAKLTH
jgi:hypothetical protein